MSLRQCNPPVSLVAGVFALGLLLHGCASTGKAPEKWVAPKGFGAAHIARDVAYCDRKGKDARNTVPAYVDGLSFNDQVIREDMATIKYRLANQECMRSMGYRINPNYYGEG